MIILRFEAVTTYGSRHSSCACKAVRHDQTASWSRRTLLLGATSAALLSTKFGLNLGISSPTPACAADDVAPAINIDEAVSELLVTTSCLSALYTHASQYVREVKAGFRSQDMLPVNIQQTLDYLVPAASSLPAFPRFQHALDAILLTTSRRQRALGFIPLPDARTESLAGAASSLQRDIADVGQYILRMQHSPYDIPTAEALTAVLRRVLDSCDTILKESAVLGYDASGHAKRACAI